MLTSKTLIDLSAEPVKSCAPPGWTATLKIGPWCPAKTRTAAGLQTRTDLSAPAETTDLLSGSIATPAIAALCSVIRSSSRPLAASQNRTDWSAEPVATRLLSSDKKHR